MKLQNVSQIVHIISDIFHKCGIKYCLIGGIAVVIHGYIRSTRDIDFLVDEMPEWENMLGVSELLGLQLREQDRGLAQEGLLILKDPSGMSFGVDLLRMESDFESDLLNRATVHTIAEIPIRVIKVEDLITVKLSTGRPQDDADAEALLEIRRQDLDMELMRKSAHILGVENKLDFFLNTPGLVIV